MQIYEQEKGDCLPSVKENNRPCKISFASLAYFQGFSVG